MELTSEQGFLLFNSGEEPTQYRVRLLSDFASAILGWGRSTRMSPVWGVRECGTAKISASDFDGESQLLFVGPTRPASILADVPRLHDAATARLWVSLGSYNIIINSADRSISEQVVRWAENKQVPFERWMVRDGQVLSMTASARTNRDGALHTRLVDLARMPWPQELHLALSEYCALMASAFARCAEVTPAFLPDFIAVNESVLKLVGKLAGVGNQEISIAQGLMTHLNAGLSRFTSQAYSGTTPIAATESHFWIHSLLGIGAANIALHHLSNFICRILGNERISQRIERLETNTSDVPNLSALTPTDERFYDDHLMSVALTTEDRKEPVVPLVTYFSGRDGFKSHLSTLSAPLATISACSSLRWTLLTATHEISHVSIRGAMSHLYPLREPRNLHHAMNLLNDPGAAKNWLDAVRVFLLHAVIAMESEDSGVHRHDVDTDKLGQMLDKWRGEIEEILAHVFDFLYFYQQNHEKYIKGIWLSWSTIPNIGNRVPEYVMRTLCATSVRHLRRGGAMLDQACSDVLAVLEGIPDAQEPSSYTAQAIGYIKNFGEEVRGRLLARVPIVRIARAFLFSETIAQKLHGEGFPQAGSRHDGYSSHVQVFDEAKITSPLRFLEAYTRATAPNAATSVWMFNTLAFNVEGAAGTNGTP